MAHSLVMASFKSSIQRNNCGILVYEDLRTCAAQLLTRLISHQDPHGSLLLKQIMKLSVRTMFDI